MNTTTKRTYASVDSYYRSAKVFPVMCPMTGKNCHSFCACYRDPRCKSTAIGTDEDMGYRADRRTCGRCDHFGLVIGAGYDESEGKSLRVKQNLSVDTFLDGKELFVETLDVLEQLLDNPVFRSMSSTADVDKVNQGFGVIMKLEDALADLLDDVAPGWNVSIGDVFGRKLTHEYIKPNCSLSD